MKKVMLFTASLLSCLSLSAESEDFATLTLAILNNNSQQVESSLKTEYSQEDLKGAFEMAKEKNKFYHQRLLRWSIGYITAILGAPIGVVLAAVAGGWGLPIVQEHKRQRDIDKGKRPKEWGLWKDQAEPIVTVGLGGIGGGTVGIGAATALAIWVYKKADKWQTLANESDQIVELISNKLGIE